MYCWSTFRLVLFSLCSLTACAASAADFQAPTPEELSMTADPAAPNASAIVLFREEVSDDNLHMHSYYLRVKVLTEAGKGQADVEIPYQGRAISVDTISARTIHSDGTIIPFTGAPFDKVVKSSGTQQFHQKVFSMPDVQVGSILEYRFFVRYQDNIAIPPTWYIQGPLYVRKAHYKFLTSNQDLLSHRGDSVSSINWYPILPSGYSVKHVTPPHGGLMTASLDYYELTIEKIPAAPDEEYLPPVHSLSYRVYFNYSAYRSSADFWKGEGKYWSKRIDAFIGKNQGVAAMAKTLTLPADSEDLKLQKLYNGVMAFENTDFTRERTAQEDKLRMFHATATTQDIVDRKRGNSSELALLFVGLARAAGMKAYAAEVTNRDQDLFDPQRQSLDQLDDLIAIVSVDGKERFFDPGERYCAYGQLHWKHTMAKGIRQVDGGTDFVTTTDDPYTDSKTVRIAAFTLNDDGSASGTVRLGYTGVPALYWRQRALEGDQTEVEHDMESALRTELPGGLTVKIDSVKYLDDPSKQLVASFKVDGPLANATAKRLFVPVEVFEANEKPKFSQPKREMPIYFHYAYQDIDQISLTLPASMGVESVPAKEQFMMQKMAALNEGATLKGNTLTLVRNFQLGTVIFKADEYDELRSFYAKVNHKDTEQAVLKVATHGAEN